MDKKEAGKMKRYIVGPHWLDKEITVSEEILEMNKILGDGEK